MSLVSRIGDTNSGGGKIITGAPTVLCNGRPVAHIGSPLTPHWKKHYVSTVITGSRNVLVSGKPVAKLGSSNSCGHKLITGSSTVLVS